MRIFFFPGDTRGRTNEDQAYKRTAVYLLEDHEVTAAVTDSVVFILALYSPSPFRLVYYQAVSTIDLHKYTFHSPQADFVSHISPASDRLSARFLRRSVPLFRLHRPASRIRPLRAVAPARGLNI